MKIQVKYGKTIVTAQLPEEARAEIIESSKMEMCPFDEKELIQSAMSKPIGSLKLSEMAGQNDQVVIVTSDITRPFPTARMLPYVIGELQAAKIPLKNITVVFALGSHRKHTEEEKRTLAGQLYDSAITFVDSDPDQCTYLGTTSAGTPVDLFRPVVTCDLLVCLGNIEYHYFAGYSGGAKALLPGVSSKRTIQRNHSMMFAAGAGPAERSHNPVRRDIDDVTRFVKVDYIMNVILGEQNQVRAAVCGDVMKAHEQGCRLLDQCSTIELKERGDIVIIGGGTPKDMNLYQAQKWLDNGSRAASDGGILIWCASADEGFGNRIFKQWMLSKSPSEMINQMKHNFMLGGHKAAAIGKILLKHQVYLVSEVTDSLIRRMGMVPFKTLQEAVSAALKEKGESSRVIVFPKAMTIFPLSQEEII